MTNLDQHIAAYSSSNPYDFDNSLMLKWYAERIVELTRPKDTALELGLGHGYTADVFSRHFGRYVVIEGSRAVIEHYEQRSPDRSIAIVNALFEQFASAEKFDVIVMGFVLEHVDDPSAILRRFKAFLAPGGRLFVAVPNAAGLNRRLGHLAGLLPDLKALSEHDLLLGHQRYYTVESLAEEVGLAGYRVEKMEGIFLKPLTTAQLVSCKLSEDVLKAMCTVGMDYPELSCGILAHLTSAT